VGIADAAYFSRVFTRLCRVAPSEYRAMHAA
jgi:AraC-like DNA-binding protein